MSKANEADKEIAIRALVIQAAAQIQAECDRLGWNAHAGVVISCAFGQHDADRLDVRSYGNAGHVHPEVLAVMREALRPCDCGQDVISEEVH